MKTPLTKEFLDSFDEEIKKAKAAGYGVAFRCNCGCHRTGRLAAYYRMKYQGWSPEDAVFDQRRSAPGVATFYARRTIQKQIFQLKDYIEAQKKDPKDMGCKPVAGSKKRDIRSERYDKKLKDLGYASSDCVTDTKDQSCSEESMKATGKNDTEDPEDGSELVAPKSTPEDEEEAPEQVPGDKKTSKQ